MFQTMNIALVIQMSITHHFEFTHLSGTFTETMKPTVNNNYDPTILTLLSYSCYNSSKSSREWKEQYT